MIESYVRQSILIAENDVLTRLTVTNMLEALGFRTVEAQTQGVALGILEGVWFDTIIISSTRDDQDGSIFAGKAKAVQPHIKTIVMSGLGHPEYIHPNVDALVAKPFSLDDLILAVCGIPCGSTKGLKCRTFQ
jgi:DNA-binding NtrC family response regulator